MHSDFRIFYRPVKATAQEGSELPNIGLYEAAAGTNGKREEPNATLRHLSPATQTIVITSQMMLCQEQSQFSGIGPDFVLSQSLFVDFRNFGLRRGPTGTRSEAIANTGPTKASGCFDSGSLDAQLLYEKGAFAFTFRRDEILEMKIWVEDKTIDQSLVQRQRPAQGADIVNLNESHEAHGLARFDELPCHLQGQSATQAVSAKHVGTLWLYLADLVDIAASHMLEPAIDRRMPV